MAEQSVPDSVPAEAMDAADEAFAKAWMNGADHVDALRLAVEAAAPILLAAGRAQAAADIRAALEGDRANMTHGDAELLEHAASIAEEAP